MAQPTLKKVFDDLVSSFPEKTIGAKPIGMGYFGIVIAHDDNTVSKFIKRQDDIYGFEQALKGFYHEVQILDLFGRMSDVGVDIPKLVGEPEELYLNGFAATYKMTKVDGISGSFQMDRRRKIDFNKLYEEVGALTARFHRIGSEGFPAIPYRHGFDGQKVPTVPNGLSDRLNRAIEKVDAYLQEHKTGGLVHGDLGVHNMMYNNYSPTGIIDFAYTGYAANQLADICLIYDYFLPYFTHGYEQEAGKKIDPNLIVATRLSYDTNRLGYMYRDSMIDVTMAGQLVEKITQGLNEMTYVTGFKP